MRLGMENKIAAGGVSLVRVVTQSWIICSLSNFMLPDVTRGSLLHLWECMMKYSVTKADMDIKFAHKSKT